MDNSHRMGPTLEGADRERNNSARVYNSALILQYFVQVEMETLSVILRSSRQGHYEKLVRFCTTSGKKKISSDLLTFRSECLYPHFSMSSSGMLIYLRNWTECSFSN